MNAMHKQFFLMVAAGVAATLVSAWLQKQMLKATIMKPAA